MLWRMMITAVVNQKGGVGKTSTTLNVGAALAEDKGARVLLVDLDPQGHLTSALRLDQGNPSINLASALVEGATGPASQLVRSHSPRLDVIPTTVDMFLVGRKLDQLRAREHRLGRVLTGFRDDYDHCLIDCPPALDTLTDNALTAADGVLIPVQAEDSSLHALHLLLAQIDAVEHELRDQALILHGLVVSMVERGPGGGPRSNIGRTVITELEKLPLPILATVPRGVTVTESWRLGKPVVSYSPSSEHAEAYRELAAVLAKATA